MAYSHSNCFAVDAHFFVASAQKGKFLDCLFFRAFEFSEICENQIYKNVKLEGVQGVITVPQTPPVAL